MHSNWQLCKRVRMNWISRCIRQHACWFGKPSPLITYHKSCHDPAVSVSMQRTMLGWWACASACCRSLPPAWLAGSHNVRDERLTVAPPLTKEHNGSMTSCEIVCSHKCLDHFHEFSSRVLLGIGIGTSIAAPIRFAVLQQSFLYLFGPDLNP